MDFGWLDAPVEDAARALLGCELVRTIDGEELRVRIVETEAYDQNDPASHTFRGQTARNAAMFMEAGHAYVYRSMGIHHCLNMVAGPAGFGAGVLIRAVEPLAGEDFMVAQRGGRTGPLVTNGPGKLCQALAVDLSFSGHDVSAPPLQLVRRSPLSESEIVTSTRIGISKAADWPRRFHDRASQYVSRR
ncbi:MAG: DNA-3-methyladenine glycosylase [Galactobacter sp.]